MNRFAFFTRLQYHQDFDVKKLVGNIINNIRFIHHTKKGLRLNLL